MQQRRCASASASAAEPLPTRQQQQQHPEGRRARQQQQQGRGPQRRNQQQQAAHGGGSSRPGGRRRAPQSPRAAALLACRSSGELSAQLAAGGENAENHASSPSTLTADEALAALRRAAELKAHDLLLLPPPPTARAAAAAAAGSPPPLSARLLELAPTMTTSQLAAVLSAYARLTTDARRVPGLLEAWLPPLREAARLLAAGARPHHQAEESRPKEEQTEGSAAAAVASEQQQQQQHHHQRSLAPLGAHDACLVAWAVGRWHLRDEPLAASIAAATAAGQVAARVGAGDKPQLLVTLAQGLAASGRHAPLAFAAIAEAARPAVRARLAPARLTLLARALATARHADEPLLDALCRAMTPALMREALVYESMGVVGGGGAGEDDKEAAEEEDSRDEGKKNAPSSASPTSPPPQIEPYHLAQLLWALAIVRHPLRPEFFAAAAAAASAMAPRMSAAEVSDVAWACARSRAYSPALYDALARRACELADAGKLLPRQASQVAWSVARQGHASAPLLSALARGVLRAGDAGGGLRLLAPAGRDSMLPFNLSNMVWAYGALGAVGDSGDEAAAADEGGASSSSAALLVVPEAPALVRALAQAVLRGRIEDFALQNLSDLAFGLSACGYGRGAFGGGEGGDAKEADDDARLLYARIADAAAAQAPQLSAHSLADLCWAFANVGAPAPHLFEAATKQAATPPGRLASGFSLGMLADLVWASARAGHRDDALLAGVAEVLALPGRAEQLTARAGDGGGGGGGGEEALAKLSWAAGRLKHDGLRKALEAVAAGAAAGRVDRQH
jgi:hypothetical protein